MRPMIQAPDFALAPLLVIWETTQACGLACRHCRADAVLHRDPRELNTEEAKGLIRDIHAMGTPILVFSGGDPLMRPDLIELVVYASRRGLRVGTIPAATDQLSRQHFVELKNAGLAQIALSLDGCTAEKHDDFRQVPGSFDRTLQAAGWAKEVGIPLQINSVVTAENADDFAELAEQVQSLGIVFWEVFFLITMGRGSLLNECTPAQQERVFEILLEFQKRRAFVVKVTEAPYYRRYVSENLSREDTIQQGRTSMAMSQPGVNAGKGFCFVSHQGEVFPSGFLPVKVGDVREQSIIEIYREAPLMQELRQPELLKGFCHPCAYANFCGGSRARAYTRTGDPLAADPACLYEQTGPLQAPAPTRT